jgi:hypothetical protein
VYLTTLLTNQQFVLNSLYSFWISTDALGVLHPAPTYVAFLAS